MNWKDGDLITPMLNSHSFHTTFKSAFSNSTKVVPPAGLSWEKNKKTQTLRPQRKEPNRTRITSIPAEEKLQSVRVGLEPGDFWWEPSEKVKRQSRTISPDALAGEAAGRSSVQIIPRRILAFLWHPILNPARIPSSQLAHKDQIRRRKYHRVSLSALPQTQEFIWIEN